MRIGTLDADASSNREQTGYIVFRETQDRVSREGCYRAGGNDSRADAEGAGRPFPVPYHGHEFGPCSGFAAQESYNPLNRCSHPQARSI